MIKATTYKETVKKLLEILETYSGIDTNRIFNALSVRGTDISVIISENEDPISLSPNLSESFVLFELIEDPTGENYITPNGDKMDTIQTYIFHLLIYGNQSVMDSHKISTIFKTPNIALELRNSGIFIKGVSSIEPNDEFINDTLYLRRDLDISLQTRYSFDMVIPDVEYFENFEGLIVKSVIDAEKELN